MAGNTPYYGSIPGIAQAFQNDPRTKLAQSALALGTSTAPVAQGGWGVTDGLARAAQAITGALMNKSQEKKYGAREQAYTQGMADAAKLASTPQPNPAALNPATVNPAMAAAAGALGGGGPAPMTTIDPNSALGGAGGAMPGAPATPLPSSPPAPVAAPVGFSSGGTGPSRGAAPVSFINPLGGKGRTTDTFGTRGGGHNGIDWAAPAGTPIAAAAPGVVITAGSTKRGGNTVRIKHPDGSITGYAHLSQIGVKPGQTVDAGVPVGAVGSTGNSTGNHLHFTITDPTGRKVNPASVKYSNAPDIAANTGGVAPVSATVPPPPQMEAVPDAPPPPPAQAPGAPGLPGEVQSNRLAMAQQLMQSGNPDLMVIAQTYLDKGLDEQNSARMQTNSQQFAQGQTGYTANLNDWTDARSANRNDQYGQRRDVQNRNFQRGERYAGQQFTAGQNAEDRSLQRETREDNQAYGTSERIAQQAYGTSERKDNQDFTARQQAAQNVFTAEENRLARENKMSVAELRAQRQQTKNAWLSTPTGLKMQMEVGTQINDATKGIDDLERYINLNENQSTGGILGALGITDKYSAFNSRLAEMNSLAGGATLSALGGSLGVAISDADRKFASELSVSSRNTPEANRNIANAQIGVLKRKREYLQEFSNAQAEGTAAEFNKEWSEFTNQVPIVRRGKATDKPITFSQWRNRERFDKNGRKIN